MSNPRPSSRSIRASVARAFREDADRRRLLDQAKRELAAERAKPMRGNRKR